MSRDRGLSSDELGYFAEIFSSDEKIEVSGPSHISHMLSVTSEVPQLISTLLGKASFTLLAEVGPYKLWFPLEISLNEAGEPLPVLGIPEVEDHSGQQRSWRLMHPKDLQLNDASLANNVSIQSVSSTGLALHCDSQATASLLAAQKQLHLRLPDGQKIQLQIEAVRQDRQLLATRIHATKANRERLRQYLFQNHRQYYQELYRDSEPLGQ